jgi:DNA-binding MarR family transcriptional regulator
MRITNKVKQVLAVLLSDEEKFFYPVEIAEAMGTGGNGIVVNIKLILKRLLNAGYIVKMDAIEVVRNKYNCKPRLYRLSTEGKKLALKHKLAGFRSFGKRMYMIVPK